MQPTKLIELMSEVAHKIEKETAADILSRLASYRSITHWDIKDLAEEYGIELNEVSNANR